MGLKSAVRDGGVNPFTMPSETDVFALRKQETEEKQRAKELLRTQKVHEKSASKGVARSNVLAAEDLKDTAFMQELRYATHATPDELAEELASPPTKDLDGQRNNLKEFVRRKKEMFLVQYAYEIKRDEISKLEAQAISEEQRLLQEEKLLDEDAAKFDAFLKENDKTTVEAIKKAEAETKLKLEKMGEIKKLNLQIAAVRSEIQKNKEQLRDYQRYKDFLWELTPVEHRGRNEDNAALLAKLSASAADSGAELGGASAVVAIAEEDATGISDYFKHPQQLLDIFTALEEKNLTVIQTTQSAEKYAEELRAKIEQIDAAS